MSIIYKHTSVRPSDTWLWEIREARARALEGTGNYLCLRVLKLYEAGMIVFANVRARVSPAKNVLLFFFLVFLSFFFFSNLLSRGGIVNLSPNDKDHQTGRGGEGRG